MGQPGQPQQTPEQQAIANAFNAVERTNAAITPQAPDIPLPSGPSGNTSPNSSMAGTPPPITPPPNQTDPRFDLTQPGVFEDFISSIYPSFGQPSNAQNTWNEVSSNLSQPTFGQTFMQWIIPQLLQPGAGSDAATGAMNELGNRGAGSTFWDTAQGTLSQPTFSQEFYAPASEQLQGPGIVQNYWDQYQGLDKVPAGDRANSNYATQAYEQFMGRMPNIPGEAGLDPYYNRQKEKALEEIKANAAGLGQYGSSTAQGLQAQAITDLAAEQANREAQYRLQQLQEQRMWEGLGGSLAGQASGEQRGWANLDLQDKELGARIASLASGEQLSRIGLGSNIAATVDNIINNRYGLMGDLALGAGSEDITRLLGEGNLGLNLDELGFAKGIGAGNLALGSSELEIRKNIEKMSLALGLDSNNLANLLGYGSLFERGQGTRENRMGDMFSRIFGMGGTLGNFASGTYGGMSDADLNLLMGIQNLLLGQTGAGVSTGQWQTNQLSPLGDIIASIIGGGGGAPGQSTTQQSAPLEPNPYLG